jgi:hypothetical protein
MCRASFANPSAPSVSISYLSQVLIVLFSARISRTYTALDLMALYNQTYLVRAYHMHIYIYTSLYMHSLCDQAAV